MSLDAPVAPIVTDQLLERLAQEAADLADELWFDQLREKGDEEDFLIYGDDKDRLILLCSPAVITALVAEVYAGRRATTKVEAVAKVLRSSKLARSPRVSGLTKQLRKALIAEPKAKPAK